MSISLRNTSGSLETVAGFSDTDAILSPTSKNPIQNKAVYDALAQKIEKTVNDLVNYYIKSDVYNKTETRALIGAINTLTIEVVATLPTTDISATTIYFVGPAAGTNNYDEYVYVGSSWVKIGDTSIDLSSYVTSTQLTTALQDYYTKTAVDALIASTCYTKSEVNTLLNAKEDLLTFDSAPTTGSNNPVTSSGIKTAVDNLTTLINTKEDALTFDTIPAEGSDNPVTSAGIKAAIDAIPSNPVNSVTNGNMQAVTSNAVYNALLNKQAKITYTDISLGNITFPSSGFKQYTIPSGFTTSNSFATIKS